MVARDLSRFAMHVVCRWRLRKVQTAGPQKKYTGVVSITIFFHMLFWWLGLCLKEYVFTYRRLLHVRVIVSGEVSIVLLVGNV